MKEFTEKALRAIELAGQTAKELHQEIDLVRKHLDNISESVDCLLGETEPEPAPTMTPEDCRELNEYLETEQPYYRWKLLTQFFERYQSEQEIQRLLLSIFDIDHALHVVTTEDDAQAKEEYPEAYTQWTKLTKRHQSAADTARFIHTYCNDMYHTAFRAAFNQMRGCLEDKMVFLWAYFQRDPFFVEEPEIQIKDEPETLHRCSASMEWIFDDEHSDREFPDLMDEAEESCDDADPTDGEEADDNHEATIAFLDALIDRLKKSIEEDERKANGEV